MSVSADPAAATFEEHRPLLFGIAYRMLGSAADAEDAVQDAYLRWHTAQAINEQRINEPRAWLATTVTRICIDVLRSARVRRESYVGPWLPDPVPSDVLGPAETVEQRSLVSLAFLALMERLSPAERAVFVLREAFDFSYDEIADALERTPVACRQLYSRAAARLADGRPRFAVDDDARTRMTLQFLATAATGDVEALKAMLTEDAVLVSDGGGRVTAARRPVRGADDVARFLVGILRKGAVDFSATVAQVNGGPCLVAVVDGTTYGVVEFDTDGEKVAGIQMVLNPEKLAFVQPPDMPVA